MVYSVDSIIKHHNEQKHIMHIHRYAILPLTLCSSFLCLHNLRFPYTTKSEPCNCHWLQFCKQWEDTAWVQPCMNFLLCMQNGHKLECNYKWWGLAIQTLSSQTILVAANKLPLRRYGLTCTDYVCHGI